jgi:hypothetical protein
MSEASKPRCPKCGSSYVNELACEKREESRGFLGSVTPPGTVTTYRCQCGVSFAVSQYGDEPATKKAAKQK